MARPRGAHPSVRLLQAARRGLDISDVGAVPRVDVTAATASRAAALLDSHGLGKRPLVGVAPGAAYGHAKRWPPARVADSWPGSRRTAPTCILVGAGGDRDAEREIESALPAGTRIVDLVGRTDLRLLIGVLSPMCGVRVE